MSDTTSVRESTAQPSAATASPTARKRPGCRRAAPTVASPTRRAGRPSTRPMPRPAPSTSSPAPRSDCDSGPSRGGSDSAAVPAVNASRKATAMPATSSTPNPRTIGTGDSSSTRKPAPVASAAVAITGTADARGPLRRAGLLHPRLVLDRVVDPEPEQDRQHRDRRHRQRRAHERHRPERDRHGGERDQQRQQPQPAAEDQAQHDRHHHEADEQQPQGRARQRVGQVLGHDRRAGDRVGGVALELELRHPHGRAHELDRLGPLRVGQRRLQPHLDQRRLRRRHEVGEARLRRRGAARRVEEQRRDEVRVVDPRQPGQPEAVLEVDLQQVAHELGVDELARRVGEPLLLGRRLPLRLRDPPGGDGRLVGLRGLGLDPRLDLVVDLTDRRVGERPRPVDDLAPA